MKTYALIVAGGKGLRMGADLPKQFLLLAGKPVLMHALEAFHKADPTTEIILVLPAEHQDYWAKLCIQHAFIVKHEVTTGGAVRFDSVRNGLKRIQGECLIAIHDGVRPLVSPELINRCFAKAAEKGAVIPVFELTESIRRIEGPRSFAVDRSHFRSVQTPQTFRSDILNKSYHQPFQPNFTDDASVVEAAGYEIALVEGNRENIKITTPQDLLLAEQLLK
ncbi:MAG TPA: 2-C-methyl-D-erythritol 4-phosphate cytidylyltransferase [Bacteroidales bacterium]|nr:2-C-methyl-D-erythritol 4-phosphate cytidylyltransferase [Bacteroidales bacterium]